MILMKPMTTNSPGAAAFLEDLIDACVMESIHVWRRGLQPLCGGRGNAFAWLVQRGCKPLLHITHLHQTLNAPSHPIRNCLLRLTADSPDLLAIIKQEGRV
jgi:adenine-specific DNA-methyltransferase